jgi:hypothetical protein
MSLPQIQSLRLQVQIFGTKPTLTREGHWELGWENGQHEGATMLWGGMAKNKDGTLKSDVVNVFAGHHSKEIHKRHVRPIAIRPADGTFVVAVEGLHAGMAFEVVEFGLEACKVREYTPLDMKLPRNKQRPKTKKEKQQLPIYTLPTNILFSIAP